MELAKRTCWTSPIVSRITVRQRSSARFSSGGGSPVGLAVACRGSTEEERSGRQNTSASSAERRGSSKGQEPAGLGLGRSSSRWKDTEFGRRWTYGRISIGPSRPSRAVFGVTAQEFPGPAFARQMTGIVIARRVTPVWLRFAICLVNHGEAFLRVTYGIMGAGAREESRGLWEEKID